MAIRYLKKWYLEFLLGDGERSVLVIWACYCWCSWTQIWVRRMARVGELRMHPTKTILLTHFHASEETYHGLRRIFSSSLLLRKYDVAGLGHVPVHRTKGRKTDWMDQGSSIFHKSSSRVNILAGTDFTPIEEKLVKLSPPCQAWLEPGRKSSHVWSCPTSSRGGWWFRQSGFPEECKVPEQQKYKLPTKEIQVANKQRKKDIQIANKRRTMEGQSSCGP